VRKRWTVAGPWLVAAGLLLAFAACGDDSSTTPNTVPTTTTTTTTQPPAAITLIRGNELILKKQLFIRDVIVGQQGTIDITVEYTKPENSILFWLTDRKCSRQMFDNDACNYLTKSLGGVSPRKATVSSVAPGTYTFFVSNDGPQDDQVTYLLELRP
jgi:hypothetical protein